MCHKPSPHLLVSHNIPTHDFIYICLSHLADRHFASRISQPPAQQQQQQQQQRLPDKVSQAEIDKVKAEYEARQKKKDDKDKDKDKEKKSASSTTAGSILSSISSTVTSWTQQQQHPEAATTKTEPAPAPAPAPVATPYPLHAKYALHREFFNMRLREYNNRLLKHKEKELNMPRVPAGGLI